jgi:26S proteasome regulatory subunit N2
VRAQSYFLLHTPSDICVCSESLYESERLSKGARDAAALLASKVYYSLGEYDEALSFALGAGNAFAAEIRAPGSEEYIETVVCACCGHLYVRARAHARRSQRRRSIATSRRASRIHPGPRTRSTRGCGTSSRAFSSAASTMASTSRSATPLPSAARPHSRTCLQAIGIALEARRLDVIQHIYEQTRDTGLLSYTMDAVIDGNVSLTVRDQVLHFLLPLFPALDSSARGPYVHALTRLLVTLGDPALTVPMLSSLVSKNKLLAYQFAFDLVEGGAQDFLESVRNDLPKEGVSRNLLDINTCAEGRM